MTQTVSAQTGEFPASADPVSGHGEVRDYFQLLKPRVMSLVVFTSIVGLLAAPGEIHWFIGMVAVLCIAIGAGASGALNMWYSRYRRPYGADAQPAHSCW